MSGRFATVLLFLIALIPRPVNAQRTEQAVGPVELRVHVVLDADDRPVDSRVRVQLLRPSGMVIAEKIATDLGQVEFTFVNSFPYTYRVRVSGPGVLETTSDVFAIQSRDQWHLEVVRVRAANSSRREDQINSAEMVGAAELNVPKKARKEYEKGSKALERKDWKAAAARFEKALELYPNYAAAYNNLGVVHMNTGQTQKGREAFAKAIEIDSRYARAYINLAMALYMERESAEVEPLLQRALASDPLNAQALTLLAQVQLAQQKPDEAAATARKVHDAPHEQFAVAHLIAARAYEMAQKEADAMAEYNMFLIESPQSPDAPRVRAALEALKARTH